jgi:hypothetical protein
MKKNGGMEVWLHEFLTSVVDGGEWSASRPGRFTSRERAHGTDLMGGWVGPRDGLDAVAKKKSLPCWEPKPGRPIRSLVAILTAMHYKVHII